MNVRFERKDSWFNKYRDIVLLVDDFELLLEPNGVRELQLGQGCHKLIAKIDFVKSTCDLEVPQGKNIEVVIESGIKHNLLFNVLALIALVFVYVDSVPPVLRYGVFVIMVLRILFILYRLTIGSDRYFDFQIRQTVRSETIEF